MYKKELINKCIVLLMEKKDVKKGSNRYIDYMEILEERSIEQLEYLYNKFKNM